MYKKLRQGPQYFDLEIVLYCIRTSIMIYKFKYELKHKRAHGV